MPDAAAAACPAQPSPPVRSTPLPLRGTLLGFDFGLARIGVATGELETGQASALTTVHAESDSARFQAIAALIAEKSRLTIDRHQLQLEAPIKTLGSFEIPVKLHPSIEASVTVRVVAAEGEGAAEEGEEA